MWQIPLLSMTLTGGLWFGVAKTDASAIFQTVLLALAAFGNAVLVVALFRLRYVMTQYLEWLETFDTTVFVAAQAQDPKDGWWTKPLVIRNAFQIMLGLAALTSLGLMVPVWLDTRTPSNSARSAAFYDRSAGDLVDRYEAIDFDDAHPWLVKQLTGSPRKRVLDIGAGTGRDAAAMARLGHDVIAVEPSDAMRGLARAIHADTPVTWKSGALPALRVEGLDPKGFDLVVMSAVWMHVVPKERLSALERAAELLAEGGAIYVTLRTGPADADRGMYAVTPEDLSNTASQAGLIATQISDQPDLLGRSTVRWKTVVLTLSAPKWPAIETTETALR